MNNENRGQLIESKQSRTLPAMRRSMPACPCSSEPQQARSHDMRMMPFIYTSIDTQERMGVPAHGINSTDLYLRRILTTPTRLSARGGAKGNRRTVERGCVHLPRTELARRREPTVEHTRNPYGQTYPRPLEWLKGRSASRSDLLERLCACVRLCGGLTLKGLTSGQQFRVIHP
jgi:hypothetical protein